MTTCYNIPLSRFNTASALQSAATHYEVNGRSDVEKMIVQILRKDAQNLVELGIKELQLKNTHVAAHP
jgi:hypothetical protein